ncbi:MAG: RHS repeat domain-containing protein, partial [Dolichospermum sp.]
LTWDYRNRLVAFVDKDATGKETQRVEFTYDALNRRIAKAVDTNPQDTTPAVVTQFIYDGQNVLLEFVDSDGAGANQPVLDTRYLHGAGVDQVLAQESAGNVEWHLTDHLGTVRDLLNNSGAVVNHFVYDSFGQVISESNPAIDTRYLFTGREFDQETGLYYYRARYYDANTGRFLSEDPIGFNGGDSNLYRYVFNQPIIFVDPEGKILPIIAAVGVGVLIGGVIGGVSAGISGGNIGRGILIGGLAGGVGVLGGAAGVAIGGSLGLGATATGIIGGALGGAASDASVQGLEIGLGSRCEFNPYETLGAAALGGLTGGLYARGKEFSFGKDVRVAPFGNRTGHPQGELPHYHRRGIDPSTGQTSPGQGIARHRPWETKSPDNSFWDRF